MIKCLRLAITPLLLLPIISLAQTDLSVATLSADKIHSSTIGEIVRSLSRRHYNKVNINDALSSNLLDSYISSLDPSRSYFYQSDIDEFETLRYRLDDEINNRQVTSGYTIYNRLQQRVIERVGYAIDRLEGAKKFDFTLNESFETDREKSPWITSAAQMDDLWRKRLKSSVLNLTLDNETNKEAKAKLIKRYNNQIKRIQQTNSEDVFQIYVNNLTRLYDPHTAYFSPRSSENFKINMSLSLQGIGAVLQTEDEFTKIVRLIPSGPADKTGKLQANDKIVGVAQGTNGEMIDIIGWRLDDVVQKIRGKKGTVVRLELVGSDSKSLERRIISITRDKVKLEEQAAQKKIVTTKVDGREYKIGVIDIPTFYIDFAAAQRGDKNYKSTTRDVAILIEELKQQRIDGLIIDLRNNGGGALQEANSLTGLFLRTGATVQIKFSNGKVAPYEDNNPYKAYDGPLAVIVNRQSASASEIFAGAIQDHRRGLIIGDQTFGKGTVQTLTPLKHGQLKLTHAKFYRISGESTQNKGVVPDISLPALLDAQEYGESSLEYALPWDRVSAVRGFSQFDRSVIFDQVQQLNLSRTDQLGDFNYMRDKISHRADLRDNTVVSLNRIKYKDNLEAEKQWQLDAENKRRQAAQLPAVKSLAELEEKLEKDKLGRPIAPESKAILNESVRILIDYKKLQQTKS
ncbi:MAG: carboxy terminal-processing peptidase [Pseudomonadales bacterium]|nr:carboxy terminal-processing peptidase [Pseudomonadales bacterium]NRA14337.1 carboxy terminal-processing peptidase [Oceanospirillaceae bacterium]